MTNTRLVDNSEEQTNQLPRFARINLFRLTLMLQGLFSGCVYFA